MQNLSRRVRTDHSQNCTPVIVTELVVALDYKAERGKVFRSDLEEEFLDQAIPRIERITSPFLTACRVLLSPETIRGSSQLRTCLLTTRQRREMTTGVALHTIGR
jgi:hypothetical protein